MKNNHPLILVVFILVLFSCKKGNSGNSTVNVYVAGAIQQGNINAGIYWKNGSPMSLQGSTFGFDFGSSE